MSNVGMVIWYRNGAAFSITTSVTKACQIRDRLVLHKLADRVKLLISGGLNVLGA